MPVSEKEHSITGKIVRISSEPRTAPKGGYLFRGVELSTDNDSSRVFVIFPDFVRENLYEFPLLCWEGAQVACFGLELNNRLDDGTYIYGVTPNSDLVLEPCRVVSVTEAVEAAACIRSADVRFRVGPEEPFWMAKGKLIHTLFEHLLARLGEPSERTFQDAFRKALPSLVSVLPGSDIKIHAKSLEAEARTHFSNIKSWLKRNSSSFDHAEVEMDRMSVRWGLKGRADAILRREDNSTVLELKSGKVPVDDHLLQLCAYSLIFSENSSRNPEGYILYSATGKAERLKELENEKKNLVLSGRNRVLSLKHSYTVNPSASGDMACGRNGKCFSRFHCNRLFGNAAEAFFPNESERRYYDRWFRVLSTDAWAQEAEFARILDAATLKDRVREGITLEIQEMRSPERIDSENGIGHQNENSSGEDPFPDTSQSGSLLKELVLSESSVDLLPGEEVIIHRGDPCRPEAFRCRVKECADEKTTVRVRIPIYWNNRKDPGGWGNCFNNQSEGWFLDRIPFSRGREVARHALFSFFDRAEKRVIASVVHDGSEEIRPETKQAKITKNKVHAHDNVQCENIVSPEDISWSLNERQESAVQEALGCQTFHLIHGPPGTGKTRVLARLIRICLERGERVLVACPTNVALDRLLLALIDLGVRNFLRLGGRFSVSKEFVRALELTHNTTALFQELASKEHDFKAFKKRVLETQLVGATAYQCTAHPVFLRQKFDRVVVDEAGQLDEPSTLGPISMASKFVLGGDHLQLPPVVKVQNPNGTSEGALLERSLFERLFDSVDRRRVSSLEIQYRMNTEIQDIPSRLFYQGLLKPSQEAATRRLKLDLTNSSDPRVNSIIDPERPVVFVDVDGAENSKARPEEAEIACRISETLVNSGIAPHEIGIITPYRAQQSLIRRRLASGGSHISSLSADTVDSFQGGEREVIILSLARSDSVTTFLADKKRLNVSLSRARSKLILLGHGPVLQEHPLFAELLQGLERVKM